MLFRVAAALAAGVLVSCGGGGGLAAPNAPVPTATPAPIPTATPAGRTASVALAIVIPPKPSSSASRRGPRFVSPATASIRVAVNGGTPQDFSVGSGTPCAPPQQTPGTCTVYNVSAPLGSDTFVVTLFDASHNVLSQGTVQFTVVTNTVNNIIITVDGIVASLHVALSNPSPPAGTATVVAVTLLPADAAGYPIVGSPGKLPSITVTDSDNSGATGLYLAGSDGTCATQAAPPATSVITAQSGTQYQPVCLRYSGASLASTTISATIAGGPSAGTTFTPSQPQGIVTGFWIAGQPPNNAPLALERIDATTLHATITFSGSNVNLVNNIGPKLGLAAETNGNIDVLIQATSGNTNQISAYGGTTGGNVPPVSTTTFALPNGEQVGAPALALDGAGAAYVIGACTIYRIPLTGGAATPTAVGDGCQGQPFVHDFSGLSYRAGRLYVTINRRTNPRVGPFFSNVFRYVRNGDGSLTFEAAITIKDERGIGDPVSDGAGNVTVLGLSNDNYYQDIERYAASLFVPGQDPTATPYDTLPGTGQVRRLAMDPGGNLLSGIVQLPGLTPTPPMIAVIPPGGHTATNTALFDLYGATGAVVP